MKKNDYCVIGIGRFGQATINTLIKFKKNVIAIDIDRKKIDEIADKVNYAVSIDTTSIPAMKEAGIDKIPNIIVAIADDLEANIMTCAVLQELKVPNIIARVLSKHHEKILNAIGVYNTIRPEAHAGVEAALRAIYQINLEISEINNEYSIVKTSVTNPKLVDQSIFELGVRQKFQMNVIMVNRDGETIFPDSELRFALNDLVTYFIKNSNIPKIQALLTGNKSSS